MVRVPASSDMDDETFNKHLNLRHVPAGDWAGLKSVRSGIDFTRDRRIYEAWHKHCHEKWGYDHDHA